MTNLPAEAPGAVCGLSVVNESVLYASGTNFPFPRFNRPPRMMKTVDGGRTWDAWDMRSHAALLVDTYFTSPKRGWVVGGKVHAVPPGASQCDKRPDRDNVKPVVLLTEDGGQTWTNRVADIEDEFPLGEWGWKISSSPIRWDSLPWRISAAARSSRPPTGDRPGSAFRSTTHRTTRTWKVSGLTDQNHGWVGGLGSADFLKGSSSETADGGQTWADADWVPSVLANSSTGSGSSGIPSQSATHRATRCTNTLSTRCCPLWR